MRKSKNKNKLLIAISALLLGSLGICLKAQPISPSLFGQNSAWAPNSFPTYLDNYWDEVAESGVKYVRIGGGSPNFRPLYQFDGSLNIINADNLIHIINKIRENLMEPIIEVGYNPNCPGYSVSPNNPLAGLTLDQQSTIAANLVSFLKDSTNGIQPIEYWIIGNEPDLREIRTCDDADGSAGGYDFQTAAPIADYIRKFSSKMKAQDPSIKIIGPETKELAFFNIMRGLTTPNGPDDITGKDELTGRFYIDVYSFHYYGWNGSQPDRTAVINKLTASGGFQDNLTLLKTRLDSCNSVHNRFGSDALKMAVDEANINFFNPQNMSNGGLGANSFLGGQFWAEMMGICMKKGVAFLNFWSIKEGCSTHYPENSNIGYLEGCDHNPTPMFRPTYHHFKMIATKFSGEYMPLDTNTHGINLKVFASKSSNSIVSVLLLNENEFSSINYTLVLDAGSSGSVIIDAENPGIYIDTLPAQTSMVLKFDLLGNLVEKCIYDVNDAEIKKEPTCTIYSCPDIPEAAGPITGDSTITPTQFVTYSIDSIPFATSYTWTLPPGAIQTSFGSTNSITVKFPPEATSGNISVYGTNGICKGAFSSLAIAVSCTAPGAPTATSNYTVCQSGTITLFSTSASNYLWTGPDGWTSAVQNPTRTGATGAMQGAYTVTTSSGTCTSQPGTTYIDIPDFASITSGGSTTFCSGGNDTLYAGTGTGYTWQWIKNGSNISGATANKYAATTAGSYQVKTSRNSGACSDWSAPVTVTVNSTLTAKITAGGPTSFCAGGSVVLYANTCSGYTYQWQQKDENGVYQIISGATGSTYTVTTAGWYQIRVNSGGNTQWSSGKEVKIADTPASAGTINGASTVSLGQTPVTYSVSLIDGADKYIWILPSGASIISGDSTNNIIVSFSTSASSGNITVAGTNGTCTGTSSSLAITVTCLPPATPTATSNNSVCQSQTINLYSTSASNYSWTGPGGFAASTQNPTRSGATVAMAGTYSVTTTSGGCTSTAGTTVVAVESFASITAGGPTTFCSGGSVTLNASTGSGYTWQWIKDGTNISGATNSTYAATTAGSYQVKITKNSGACSAWSATVAVAINSTLTATITAGGPTTFCPGGSVILYANTCSGYTYQWQKKDGGGTYQVISGATSSTYTVTTAGWYQIKVSSGGSNQWSSGKEVIISTAPAAAGTISGLSTIINGQNAVTYFVPLITGATSYIWTLPSGATILASSVNSIIVNFSDSAVSGNITVVGYNGTCSGISSSKWVTVNCPPPTTPVATSNNSVCQSTTINLYSTSASNYSWTGPGGFAASSQNPTRTGATLAMAGTYSVTTTSGGCTSAAGTTVVVVEDFASITAGGPTTFCSGGSVVLYAETGTGYTYQWKKNGTAISGATASTYTATTAGSYQVKISKNSGACSAWSALVTVTINSSLTATITPGGPTTFCPGGSVVLYANTCSGYTYQWQKKDGGGTYQPISGATSSSYIDTTSGWYQVRVTSGGVNRWSSGIQTFFGAAPAAAGAISGSSIVILGQNTVYYSVPAISGASGYIWTLPLGATVTAGAGTNNITVNFSGSSVSGNITVAGTNGTCSGTSSSKVITVNCTPPSAPTATSNGGVCQTDTIKLFSTSAANYLWTGPDGWTSSLQNPTRPLPTVAMEGNYRVTTSSGGCISKPGITYVKVANYAAITPGSSTTFCSGSNVTLYASTGNNYTWQWIKNGTNISGATSYYYLANTAGNYQVKITNSGCVAWTAITVVTVNSSLTATITPGGPTSFCGGGFVNLYANTCSGYTHQWQKKDINGTYQVISGATTPTYKATTEGWYQIRVTSGGVNQYSTGIEVIVNPCKSLMMANDSSDNTNEYFGSAFKQDINTLSIYPNPTFGNFTVQIEIPEQTDVTFEVINLLGQSIFKSEKIAASEGILQRRITMNGENKPGLYIVKAQIGNRTINSKFILTK